MSPEYAYPKYMNYRVFRVTTTPDVWIPVRLYGLKFDPFSPEVPTEALYRS